MTIPTPVEFWTLNNTLVGAVAGNTLVSGDGLDHYVDPGKIGQGFACSHIVPGQWLKLVNANLVVPQTPCTYMIWFRPTVWLTSQRHILNVTNSTKYSGFRLFSSNSPTSQLIVAQLIDSAGTVAQITSGFIPKASALNVWQFSVVTWDGTLLRLYLNSNAPVSADGSALGSFDYGDVMLGISQLFEASQNSIEVDAIGFWNTVLSDSQVAELYNSGNGWEFVPPDPTPDAFAFTPVSDADPSAVYESNSQTITGIDAGTAISITGGEYRLDGGAWTSDAGTINPGQTLELRATSSAESEGVVTVSVTVGTVTVDWTITTAVISSVVTHIIGDPMISSKILKSRIVRGWI